MGTRKFTLLLVVATFILCIAYIGVLQGFNLPRASNDISIFIIVFIVTLLGYTLILKAKEWSSAYLVPIILASIVIRLLIFTVANFVIIYSAPTQATPNVLLFFSIYFVYTLLETTALFKLIQQGAIESDAESK